MTETTTTTETLVLDNSDDLKIVKTECFDADIMEIILRDKRFAAKNLRTLSMYKKNRRYANEVEVVYHRGKGLEKLGIGRLFPHGGLGLQAFPHDIRNPLLAKYYWDVDMENAHYVFMIKIADKYGLRNDAIKYYVANRDACLKKVSANRRTAKTAYLKTGYGGDVKLYSSFYEDDKSVPEGDISQLKEVEAEIQPLVTAIWNDPNWKHLRSLACVKTKSQPRFSLFSYILQDEEVKCLLLIDAVFKTKNRAMDIYIHDGGEVRKLPNEVAFPASYLREAEEVVFKQTNHKIKLVVKPMEHNYTPPPTTGSILIDDDYNACIQFNKLYGSRLVRGVDNWYVNKPETNVWEVGDGFVKNLIMIANFRKPTELGSIAYGANTSGCNNIFAALCSAHDLYPRNDNFINEINLKTKGKVYFQDKYWDLKQRKWFFIGEEEDPIIPLIYIKRPAPTFENITPEEIAEFTSKCLNMFSTDLDRNLFLRAMSRALGGYIDDKVFYLLKGERNSGKGVIQENCVNAFGEYCCVYDPPMLKSHNAGDASEFRWVLAVKAHLKRVGFTNEAKNIDKGGFSKKPLQLDGNVLKKNICSGGDSFLARGHRENEFAVKFNATTFMCLNAVPESNPPDALDVMIPFDMPYKFVDADTLSIDPVSYRLRDDNIKDKIKNNTRWAEIFLYLLFENFTDKQINKSDMSELNLAECNFITKMSDALNPITLFNSSFTADAKGWVRSEDIKKVLAPANLSDVKFGYFLTARGFKPLRKMFDVLGTDGKPVLGEDEKPKRKLVTGYSGLALKQKDEENEPVATEDAPLE